MEINEQLMGIFANFMCFDTMYSLGANKKIRAYRAKAKLSKLCENK